MNILPFLLILNIADNIESKTRKGGKSVNLALETVLEFDEKDLRTDTKIINDVQDFLSKIKLALNHKSPNRRSNDETKAFKLTDFLEDALIVLTSYKNNDLREIFTAIDNEMRKYHYKGCKFYELLESYSFRKFLSKKLHDLRTASVKEIRGYMQKLLEYIKYYKEVKNENSFLNFINSLYSSQDLKQNMTNMLEQMKTYNNAYNSPIQTSHVNLTKMVQYAIRTILFDTYSNLNSNVRKDVKKRLKTYWNQYALADKEITNEKRSQVKNENADKKYVDNKYPTTRNIATTARKKPTDPMDAVLRKRDKVRMTGKGKVGGLSRIDLDIHHINPGFRANVKLKPLKPVKSTTEAVGMQTLWVEERVTKKKLLWNDDYEDGTDSKEDKERKIPPKKDKKHNKIEKKSGSDKSDDTHEISQNEETHEEKNKETSSSSSDLAQKKKHKVSKSKKHHRNSKGKKPKHLSTSESEGEEDSDYIKSDENSDERLHTKKHKKQKNYKSLRIGNTKSTKIKNQDYIALAHKTLLSKNSYKNTFGDAGKSKIKQKIKNDSEKSKVPKNKIKNELPAKSSESLSSEASLNRETYLREKNKQLKTTPKKVNSQENESSSDINLSSDSDPGTDKQKPDKKVEIVVDKESAREPKGKVKNETENTVSEAANELEKEDSLEKSSEDTKNITSNDKNGAKSFNSSSLEEKSTTKQKKETHKNRGKFNVLRDQSTSKDEEEYFSLESVDLRKKNSNDTFVRKANNTEDKQGNNRTNKLEKQLETMKHKLEVANVTVDDSKVRRFKIIGGSATKQFKTKKTTSKMKKTEKITISSTKIVTSKLSVPTTNSVPTTKMSNANNATKTENISETTTSVSNDNIPYSRAKDIIETLDKNAETGMNKTLNYSYEEESLNTTDKVDKLLEKNNTSTIIDQNYENILGLPNQETTTNTNVSTTTKVDVILTATDDISGLFTTGNPVTDLNGNNIDSILSAPNATMIIPFGISPDSADLVKMGKVAKRRSIWENDADLNAVMRNPFEDLP